MIIDHRHCLYMSNLKDNSIQCAQQRLMVHVLAHAQQAVYLICMVIVLLCLCIICNRWSLKMKSVQTAMVASWSMSLRTPSRLPTSSAEGTALSVRGQ